AGPDKLTGETHGAFQLARPLEQLDLRLEDPAAVLFPTDEDRESVKNLIGNDVDSRIVIHPGSGSETKNWPIENWKTLGDRLLAAGHKLLIVSGEADEKR